MIQLSFDCNNLLLKGVHMIIELNSENFDQETRHGLKLVEFYTTWCSYCTKQRIELQELEDSDIKIGIVDAEESPEIAEKYEIEGYPTFVLLKDGEKITEFAGFHKKDQLLNRLMDYLKV